jgi:hypothetical protein
MVPSGSNRYIQAIQNTFNLAKSRIIGDYKGANKNSPSNLLSSPV